MAVTRQWTLDEYQHGVSAVEVYWVDASNEEAARNTGGVPYVGVSNLRDARLLIQQAPVTRTVVPGVLYELRVRYERLRAGQQQEEDDPRDQAPILHWQIGSETHPVDADVDGNPLLNSVGDLYEGQTEEFVTLHLAHSRNVSTFDVQRALYYSNKINSDSFTINGPNGNMTVNPGQALCQSIGSEPYAMDAKYVTERTLIEFREDGFDRRLVDQGLNGIWSDNGRRTIGQFCNDATPAQIITTPCRLDGGKPIKFGDVIIKVIDKGSNPQTPQNGSTPAGATPERKTGATFLKYKRKKQVPFTGLI